MAKRHKGPQEQQEQPATGIRSSQQSDLDEDLIRQASAGNAAFQELFGVEATVGEEADFLTMAAGEVGQRLAASPVIARVMTALVDVPRDAELQRRLVKIVERSALPERDKLVERLREGQARAVAATAILEAALGPLDDVARSRWSSTFELADAALGSESEEASHVQIAAAVAGPGDVAQMCANILRAYHLEEEEESSGMDYATEESGM